MGCAAGSLTDAVPASPPRARSDSRVRLPKECIRPRITQDSIDCSEDEAPHRSILDRLDIGKCLGQGSFGTVYAARPRNSGDPLAVKVVAWSPNTKDNYNAWAWKVQNEALIWDTISQKLRHDGGQHVLLLHDWQIQDGECTFVMPRADATLWQYMVQNFAALDELFVGKLLRQMLTGIQHVHACDIVHSDVKNTNFLVQGDQVKLIDFGLSRTLGKPITGCAGTAPFMSPEMVAGEAYGKAVDVWAFGVVAYTLLCGCFPYMPEKMTPPSMKSAIRDNLPAPSFAAAVGQVSHEATQLLRGVLERLPERRPSAAAAMKLVQLQADSSTKPQLRSAYSVGAFS